MHFLLTWELFDHARAQTMDTFGRMGPEQDAADHGPSVIMLGRWSDIGRGRGWCIAEAPTAEAIYKWVYNWSKYNCRCSVTTVVDDDQARRILRAKYSDIPGDDWSASYYNPKYEPADDEALFLVEFAFNRDKVEDGYRAFAGMTEAQDVADAGDATPLGRWHDLGAGRGVVVAAAKDTAAVQKWAANWSSICACAIVPVLSDAQARAVVKMQ